MSLVEERSALLRLSVPVMLPKLTHATGWPAGTAMGAFSTGLVVSALAGIPVGRLLDRYGPRPVMTAGSAIGVAVLAIAAAPSPAWFFAAWVLAGLAQSAVLYPPAFAALTRWHGPQRVRALTTLSLIAGLSSTIFAPLTAVLVARLDWRVAYIGLAVLLAVVTIPLHALCLTPAWPAEDRPHVRGLTPGHVYAVLHSRTFAFLVVAMVLGAFGMGAATLNLVPLFTSRGSGYTVGAIALGLCGAGQVLGRLGCSTLTRRTTPRGRTMAVLAAEGVTVALLAALPGPDAALIAAAVLAGCVRGLYTLLQATAISDRWAPRTSP